MLKRDSKLGKYVIREHLGSGGMGVVYKAREAFSTRKVAIKMILGHKLDERGFLERFRREATVVAQVEHPNIVKLLDFVDANPDKDEPPYMVMEFLEGHDLGWIIEHESPLAITRVVDRIVEAIAAVERMHQFDIIHRDIKPSNIFVTSYQMIEITKMLDFGTARSEIRRPGQGSDPAELTRDGQIVGTLYYTPPEVFGGGWTAKSDQYCLGTVLYTALGGVKPFDYDAKGDTQYNQDYRLAQAIMKGDYIPLRTRRKEVPAKLAAIIAKAMSVNPADRYEDLHTFGAQLRFWASPQIQTTWEAHFTSGTPMKRDLQLSIAILPSEASSLDGPTTRASKNRESTMSDSITGPTRDINLATTAVQNPLNASSSSLSIEFDEMPALPPPVGDPSPTPITGPRPTFSAAIRRPGGILISAALVVAAALVTSIYLTHSKARPIVPATPPPELFTHPTPQPTQATTPQPTPPPPVAPRPDVPIVPALQSPETTPLVAQPHRTVHRHHKRAITDQNGIPIPSD